MTAVLEAENLRRQYAATVALDGVSLTLAEGEVFVLVGPNGAGKTTLVRALTGTTAAEGRVRLFGRVPRDVSPERLGALPQAFRPYDRLTVGELVSYYAGLYDDPRPVDAVLADVGLAGDADTWYERLSGGQQRRACVATAIVNDPDLLVLDEPTTGIDPAGRRAIRGLVSELASGGTTVLLTTHAMSEAERLGDRVGLLADGRLVACDTPAALTGEYGGAPRLSIEGVTDASVPERIGYPTTLTDGTLEVSGVGPRDIGTVLDQLEAAGVDPSALRWREPDLEDAFLALTDEGEGPPPAATAESGDGTGDGGGRP
jgi:ABC-2 type transport system ATP-binding protein